MIAIEQIRAARAMLNWSQRELAAAAGISLRNLHNIEAGLVVPRLQSLKSIKSALEKANIEFMTGCAVALRRDVFELGKYEGEGALEQLLQDIMSAYRQGAPELLICKSVEERWLAMTSATTSEDYFRTMLRYRAKERCLIARGDRATLGHPTTYRWLPKEYFSEVCYVVFGDALALIVWRPTLRIVTIRNTEIAESYKRHFEFVWKSSEIPPFSEEIKQKPLSVKSRVVMPESEIRRIKRRQIKH